MIIVTHYIFSQEQRYPAETFLPLTALDVHPINEKLRNLHKPKGVKLVYDVIQVSFFTDGSTCAFLVNI